MTRLILGLALLCLFSVTAEARQKSTGLHPRCNIDFPCIAPSASTPEQARVTRGRYISRQLGWGAPVEKRAVRPAKTAKVDYRHIVRERPAQIKVAPVDTAFGAPTPSIGYSIARPMRYIAGRLICAVNVNAALAERGIKGTGSALAMSFRGWGRSAGGPVPGAVIVSARRGGGHVAIVSRVENGVVYAWNATGGQRGWREIPYRHRVIDYRVPS